MILEFIELLINILEVSNDYSCSDKITFIFVCNGFQYSFIRMVFK